ncbi:MAG TPA: MBL fold metallo-hydrolase [Clostridiales bacterium]|nr:MBL fold metallo-hydrolase [Clostridiales bacterium]
MKLKCLGSDSTGNCYLLENEEECLVLEAGLPFKKVKEALDFNISKIAGVLVTHEHGDHAAYAKDYVSTGIMVYTSRGTAEKLDTGRLVVSVMRPGYWYQLGGFKVTPFNVVHDAAEPFGFLVWHADMGDLLFASDTEYIKQNFRKREVNHIMVECNYSQKIIDRRMHQGEAAKGLRDRIIQSHMELETCKEFIRANISTYLDNVILLHLSDSNSDERLFREEVQGIVGPSVNVFIADKGLCVDLDSLPFN